MEAFPDAIVVVDARRHIVLVNAAAERLLGYARRELLGQPASRFVSDEVWDAPESGLARRRGASARCRDGRELPVHIRVSTLETRAGRVSIGTLRPAGREPEDRVAASSPPGDQLAEVSHDLRNSLGVIANAVHYLGMVLPGDPRVRKHLDLIQREVAAATHLLGGLLQGARPPRADGPESRPEPAALALSPRRAGDGATQER